MRSSGFEIQSDANGTQTIVSGCVVTSVEPFLQTAQKDRPGREGSFPFTTTSRTALGPPRFYNKGYRGHYS